MTRLAHLSDLHFGDADAAMTERLAESLHAIAPDVVVATGDLTQKGSRREFEAARAFLSRFDASLVIAPGNHDTPLFNLAVRGFAPFRRFRRHTPRNASAHAGEAAAIATLNTARGVQPRLDWSLGKVSLSDARKAAAELSAAPPGAARIIACHHPLLTPAGAPMRARTRNGRAAAAMFAGSGIDLVMTGHLHSAFLEPLPGGDGRTWALGASTALSSRTRGEPAGFNLVEVRPDRFVIDTLGWDGSGFEVIQTREAERRTVR